MLQKKPCEHLPRLSNKFRRAATYIKKIGKAAIATDVLVEIVPVVFIKVGVREFSPTSLTT